MLAQSHARKPAPPLAARGMWLRLHGGADAFGSALGDAVVGSIVGGDQKKAPQKQEPEYQSKPLTQADINGFLEGLDDPSLAPVARDGVNFKALKDAARAGSGMGPIPGALNELGGGLYGIDIPLSSTPGQVAQKGDSWAKLARQQYGDERYALALAQANGGGVLKEGQSVSFTDLSGTDLKQGGRFIADDAQSRASRQTAAAQQATAVQQAQSCSSVAACKEMSTQFARQAETFGKAAAYYKERGDLATSNQYMKAAIDAGLASGAASDAVRAATPKVSYGATSASIPSSPFSAGWNTGEYSAGIALSRPVSARAPDMVNFQVDFYVGSVWGTFTRDGNSFVGGGVNFAAPNPVGVSASVSVGWLDRSSVAPGQTNSFAGGYAGGGAAAYGVVGGGKIWSPGNGSATVIGIGAGVTLGKTTNIGGVNFGYSWDQGKTGLSW